MSKTPTRVIKFRAWDHDNKNMLTLDSDYPDSTLFQTIVSHIVRSEPISDSFSVMQFTGLKDKNGIEIYEGDIVVDTRDKEKKPQEVRWFRGGFMLQTKGHFGFHDIERYDGDCNYFEVIGNIHDKGVIS